MRPTTLEAGQTYGFLTLIKRLPTKNKHGAFFWLCRCSCGQEKTVSSAKVRRGDSCGCINKQRHRDRGLKIGQRFGKLVVHSRLDKWNKWRSRYYLCKCDCGGKKVITSHSLTVGGIASCGCLKMGVKLPHGEAAFNHLFLSYQHNAKRRALKFCLGRQTFRDITQLSCTYCNCQPSQKYGTSKANGQYIYNGIDRVDSSKGYFKKNCVPCCGTCNKMKMAMGTDEFLKHVQAIAKHQGG